MKNKIIAIAVAMVIVLTLFVGVSAETVLKGDIDGNGKITASDARKVLRFAASLDPYTDKQVLLADIDGNGRITASDARSILRCAANLQPGFGTITIDEESSTNKQEAKSLTNDFTLSVDKFIAKHGSFTENTLDGGVVSYKGHGVTVLSDPKMVAKNRISSIIIDSADYSLCGVSPDMSKADIVSALSADNWREKENNSSVLVMSKIGMLIQVKFADDKAVTVEYTLAESLVGHDPTTKPSDDPTTEPSTKPSDPTTEPSTVPPVKPSEPTTVPGDGDMVGYDGLPDDIKAFVSGSFGFSGYSVMSESTERIVMYTNGKNVSASMSFNLTDSSVYNIKVLVLQEKDLLNKPVTNTYICCENTKKSHKLSDLEMKNLQLSPDSLSFNYGEIEHDKVVMTVKDITVDGEEFKSYTMVGGELRTEIYTQDGAIKRIASFNEKDVITSQMIIDEFYPQLPENVFSLKGYSNSITMLGIFGLTDMLL